MSFARTLLISMVLIMTSYTALCAADMNKNDYVLPSNMEFKVISCKTDNNDRIALLLEAKSLTGELKDLKIRFTSSKDLKVITNTREISSLKKDESRQIKILAVQTGFVSDSKKPWLKILVNYLPDYASLEKLASDAALYPQVQERERLIANVKARAAANERYTDGYRHTVE